MCTGVYRSGCAAGELPTLPFPCALLLERRGYCKNAGGTNVELVDTLSSVRQLPLLGLRSLVSSKTPGSPLSKVRQVSCGSVMTDCTTGHKWPGQRRPVSRSGAGTKHVQIALLSA